MSKLLILVLCSFALPAVARDVYQWVDKEGNTQFSESAPVNNSQNHKVEKIVIEDFQTAPNLNPSAANTTVPSAGAKVLDANNRPPDAAIPKEIGTQAHPVLPQNAGMNDEQRVENLKNSLKVVCNEHAENSPEKRQCQAQLQEHVKRRCLDDKDPVSRRAYCMLAMQQP
ncbi:MAG: hypothetical protein RIS84_1719 [Pseudomonadota bacterium]|jgi:hypothetical protein